MNKNTSLYRAAVLLKSLPKSHAAKILSRLDTKDLKTVLGSLDDVEKVSSSQLKHTLKQFVDHSNLVSPESSQQPTQSVRGDSQQGQHAPTTSTGNSEKRRVFGFLVGVLPEIQIHLLENEHPKNIAMVLSMLPTNAASVVMNGLEAETRVSVLRRLCQTDEFDLNEMHELNNVLESRLEKLMDDKNFQQRGVDIASKLLSCVDDKTLDSILVYLNQEDPELAEKLEHSVLKFEDIVHFSDNHVKTILRNTDTSLWAPALKSSCLEARTKILKNLAPTPAAILSNELETIGPVATDDVENAQHQIVNICIALNEKGKISLKRAQQTHA